MAPGSRNAPPLSAVTDLTAGFPGLAGRGSPLRGTRKTHGNLREEKWKRLEADPGAFPCCSVLRCASAKTRIYGM